MYVNPFWFGMLFTVGMEVILLFILLIYLGGKK